ncbi:MAG: hypothetical protein EAY75_11530 [Bacteroidetes bacterium]|nr:MAG: hypothetical protein EAY75_11530 [Bacteroidota bacterium]
MMLGGQRAKTRKKRGTTEQMGMIKRKWGKHTEKGEKQRDAPGELGRRKMERGGKPHGKEQKLYGTTEELGRIKR